MRFFAAMCLCLSWASATESPKALFDRAAQALAAGDYPAAEQGFQAVLRAEPQNVGALGNLGVIYSRTNRTGQAIASYRKALRASPDDEAILLNLGLAYLKQENHKRALPLFAKVVAMDPAHQQARQLLAVCRIYTGQVALAIRDLESLRAAHPKDEQVLFLVGFAYLKKNDPTSARKVFEDMFAVAGPARAEFLVGQANYEASQFADAEKSFLEVLRIDPAFPGLHLQLGKLYISQRRTEEAMRELQTALRSNPADENANYFLGSLLVQDGRYADSIPYLERAGAQNPDSWPVLLNIGKARLRMNQPAEAVAALQRAVELNPDEGSAYYQLGRALQACGRQADARRAFERAQEVKAGKSLDTGIPGIR